MERGRRRRQIPVFGEWNQLQLQQCEELPMTQYFESAMQAGLVVRAGRCCYHHDGTGGGEAALSSRSPSGSPPPHKPAKKVRSAMDTHHHQQQQEQVVRAVSRRRQQGAPLVADGAPRRPRVVRSVDEDLYKVHPDLLPKKGKGRKHVRSLWMGCVGLNCVA
ncbi:uncharacterized protein LOC120665848 isoform X2 [Panicum virgatum]|uniref:uncharacterized protein LOC120665848 isoform X2 n=1 Tax=Panicum virgatum TaxID=38727 RepID=UPI0019D55FCC|nr:uncharacterized protein LOC120665848 isoform X2 [Panicum virgatum]